MRFLLLSLLALAIGCASEPNLEERTSREFVVTKFDPAADFPNFATFAIVPTVSLVSDVGDGGTLGSAESQEIIDRIVENLEARGYVRVDSAAAPDLGVIAAVLVRIRTATFVAPGYWWGAPGYAGTPAFWGFPSGAYGVPWTYSSVAYKSGTLIIDVANLRDVRDLPAGDGGLPINVVWTAIAHGYVSLTGSLLPSAPGAIDQAFVQSPYFRKN